jgi:cytochrome c oxidase cbb3-type subunit 1
MSGISMDIGMSLLVINLAMTALTSQVVAPAPGLEPGAIPVGRPAE